MAAQFGKTMALRGRGKTISFYGLTETALWRSTVEASLVSVKVSSVKRLPNRIVGSRTSSALGRKSHTQSTCSLVGLLPRYHLVLLCLSTWFRRGSQARKPN